MKMKVVSDKVLSLFEDSGCDTIEEFAEMVTAGEFDAVSIDEEDVLITGEEKKEFDETMQFLSNLEGKTLVVTKEKELWDLPAGYKLTVLWCSLSHMYLEGVDDQRQFGIYYRRDRYTKYLELCEETK